MIRVATCFLLTAATAVLLSGCRCPAPTVVAPMPPASAAPAASAPSVESYVQQLQQSQAAVAVLEQRLQSARQRQAAPVPASVPKSEAAAMAELQGQLLLQQQQLSRLEAEIAQLRRQKQAAVALCENLSAINRDLTASLAALVNIHRDRQALVMPWAPSAAPNLVEQLLQPLSGGESSVAGSQLPRQRN